MVKKGYEHIDMTFSKNNEKEMELYQWLNEKSGILSATALAKQLLFQLMIKEKEEEKRLK
ncbi:hypothetical protein [Clostridium botulinum]|uniref:hypothetical protein n=1 Tax=Clostridium botulinum TaxID=1491 RepID=UPI00077464AA|nr:hypothetical protein [Clostridium botulinum]